MKGSARFSAIAAATGMLILILDGKTALLGASEGIELCLKTLIPSLFPFFILSSMMTNSLSGQSLPLLYPFGKFCHIPKGLEFILAIGFLGGYPVGAQSIAQVYHSGSIKKEDAERLVAFSNNAGPSFLFGVAAPLFSDMKTIWIIWGIHIVSALFVGIILPAPDSRIEAISYPNRSSFTILLQNSIRVMATVCSLVILFRMVIVFLNQWILWLLPNPARVFVAGILELSNGCLMLHSIPLQSMRFIFVCVFLSFGGICVSFQTFSVCRGMSMGSYIIGKLLQTIFSAILALITQDFLFDEHPIGNPAFMLIMLFTVAAILTTYIHMSQKRSSIPQLIGV